MKNNNTKSWKALLAFIIMVTVAGCGEMLDNPTIDEDTGEDITLLLVDFNFFTTRVSYEFVDAENNSTITKPVKMWFTGTHANDIVDYAGKKHTNYNTSLGKMELTVDPNLDISETSPMDYTVNIEIDGYLPFSQKIKINKEGKKTFELLLTKESAGEEVTLEGEKDGDSYIFSFAPETTKSAQANLYKINFSISGDSFNLFTKANEEKFDEIKNPTITLLKYYDFPFIVDNLNMGETKEVGLQVLESGILVKIMINGQRVANLNKGSVDAFAVISEATDILGFAVNNNPWDYKGLTYSLSELGAKYDFLRISPKEISALGCKINFSATANVKSSFSIDGVIKDEQGNFITTVNFKGNFPETFILENVPSGAAQISFRNNNPSFDSIPPISIPDLSTGEQNVVVSAANGYEQYQVILKALCKNNTSIAVAPTYSAEIRIEGSGDYWQGVDMIGGKVDILAKPNEKYEIRLVWNDKEESTTFSTNIDEIQNYGNQSGTTITIGKTEDDSRTQIKIDHQFDQDICDDMDW